MRIFGRNNNSVDKNAFAFFGKKKNNKNKNKKNLLEVNTSG
jgi:hypothetical protein